MKPVPVIALGLSLALSTTACGVSAMQTQTPPSTHVDVKDNQPPRPQIKRNPHPTAYEITMTIENGPGPFGSVQGFMQYETALDDPCLPDLGGMSGTRMRLIENVPVVYEKTGENTYRATVYSDLLVDEDYYGLGVCHWSMIEARVQLKASEEADGTTFTDGLSTNDLEKNRTKTAYFPKKHYPTGAIPDLHVPGMQQGSPAKEKWPDEQLFRVGFAVEKVR